MPPNTQLPIFVVLDFGNIPLKAIPEYVLVQFNMCCDPNELQIHRTRLVLEEKVKSVMDNLVHLPRKVAVQISKLSIKEALTLQPGKDWTSKWF